MLWLGMADISQITEPYSITFLANTSAANLWMRELYGRHIIYFDLPEDQSVALAFIEAAKSQGFSIEEAEVDS